MPYFLLPHFSVYQDLRKKVNYLKKLLPISSYSRSFPRHTIGPKPFRSTLFEANRQWSLVNDRAFATDWKAPGAESKQKGTAEQASDPADQ